MVPITRQASAFLVFFVCMLRGWRCQNKVEMTLYNTVCHLDILIMDSGTAQYVGHVDVKIFKVSFILRHNLSAFICD